MQRLSRHRSLTILVAIFAVLGLAFASARSGRAAPTPATDANAILQQAAKTMDHVSSFHFLLTNERGSTVLIPGLEVEQVEGDVQRPGRFQAQVIASFHSLEVQVKVIGTETGLWITNPLTGGGDYQKLSGNTGAAALINPDTVLLAAVKAIKDPKVAGQAKINGVQTTEIDGSFDLTRIGTPAADLPLGAGKPLPVKLWIDGSGHVVRLSLEGPLTSDESNDVVRRLDLSKFDQKIEITPPTPSPSS